MMVLAALFGLAGAPVVRGIVGAATGRRPSHAATAIGTTAAAMVVAVAPHSPFAGPSDPVFELVALPLAVLGVALVHIDLAIRRLPDVLVLTAYPVLGAALIVGATVAGRPDALLRGGLAAAGCLAVYGAVAATGSLGGGDAKLAGLLGLALGWLSWTAVMTATVLAFVFAAPFAVAALGTRGRRATIPFGPPMLLGALTALAVA
ncbi:MAG: prepilin peptidase [Stackebrandtia sp.]